MQQAQTPPAVYLLFFGDRLMRKITAGVLVSVFALSASLPIAYAQAQGTPDQKPVKAASACKGLDEKSCAAPTCKWIKPTKDKKGKERKGYCRTAPASKAKPA